MKRSICIMLAAAAVFFISSVAPAETIPISALPYRTGLARSWRSMKVDSVFSSPNGQCVYLLTGVTQSGIETRLMVFITSSTSSFLMAPTHIKGYPLPNKLRVQSLVQESATSHKAFVNFLLSISKKRGIRCGPYQ